MKRKKRTNKRRAKVIKGTTKIKLPTQEYHFPNPGVTVKATSMEEAQKKFQELVKKTK